jgi:hypothetical protein
MVRTGAKTFSDGVTLDLIADRDGKTNFIVWDGKCAKAMPQFVHDGARHVPLLIDPSIMRSLHLPRDSADYGSTRKLFDKISSLISRVTQAGEALVQLSSFFVFATWVGDTLPVAPFLWIVSPPTTSSAPLEQVLGLLCRRALVVSSSSLGEFYSLTGDLHPTFLTKVFQPTRRFLDLLSKSTRRGALMAAGGKAIDATCAKAVFAREPLRDSSSAGFPLELALSPTRNYIPLLDSSEAQQIAAEFQAQLLRYRLRNLAKVGAPEIDLSQFTVPVQEIAYSLGACIVGDDELQARIVPLLEPVDAEIQVTRASLLPAFTLEVLLARCHGTTGRYFPVTDLTGDLNTLLRGRGETLEVSPENTGWTLRALGLHTNFISGGRKGLVLTNELREKIHDLAAGYGVQTLRAPSAKIECAWCAALKLPWAQANGRTPS